MARTVTDAAILMDALLGYDVLDPAAFNVNWGDHGSENLLPMP